MEVIKENGRSEIISLDQIHSINGRSVLDNEQVSFTFEQKEG